MRFILVYITLLLLGTPHSPPSFLVLSWNIRDFGATKDDAEIGYIASVLKDFDLACIQEVVAGPGGAQAAARLADALNRTGAAWDYAISAPTHSSSPQKSERYAVFWKKSNMGIKGKPSLIPDIAGRIEREPFMAGFSAGGKPLIVWNYHARTHTDHPEEEIEVLAQLLLASKEAPILVAGDFNAFTDNAVFNPLWEAHFKAAPWRQATTLRRELPGEGQSYLLHPIDFFLFSENHFRVLNSGYVDLVQERGSLEAAREISDHVPVWVRFELK